MANVFKGKVDIKNVRPPFKPVFVQYDHARLEIELLDNGQTYDLSTATRVEFTHVRSDKLVITHSGEIVTDGNRKIIRYEYRGTEMDVIGLVDTSFAVFDADNKKVSSHAFLVEIRKDLRDEQFNPAEPNYGLLQMLIDDVEDLKLNGGGSGGRGPKGDPFLYTDFTPSQLEALRGPQGPQGESGLTREEILDEISNLSTANIKAPEYNPEEGVELVETNIPITLINGYVQSATGAFDGNGTNWKTLGTLINNNGENTYKVKSNVSGSIPQIRVLIAAADTTFLGSTVYLVNEEFTIPSNAAKFTINFTLPDAVPNSYLTPFPDIETLNMAQLVRISRTQGESSGNATVSDALASIEKRLLVPTRALRVLMVGNSFSEDVSQYIHNIANSAGVDAIFGNLYRPGESLEGHWNQINTGANSYTYHLRSSLNGEINHTQTNNMSFLDVIKSQDWDVITYQQASPLSGVAESFSPYLESIIDFVNLNKTNPNLRHVLHMTWAYPSSSTESGFANYNNNQQTMYAAIVNAYQQAMFDNDIDLVIPVGTAIQNARTISYLQTLNNDLASDGFHLGDSGDFIGGLTIFEALIAAKYKKDIFEDVKISLPNAKYHAYLSKLAVKNAILNPFNVTDI